MPSKSMIGRGLIALILATVCLGACQKEYDWERKDTPTRTLGHELFVIWRKDAARSDENVDAKVKMLEDNYIEFVDAIDTMAPADELETIDQFLINLLKVVDEGILPALTRKLSAIIAVAVENPQLLAALATPTGPEASTFVDPLGQANLAGYASGYPRLPELLSLGARVIVENDGITDDGLRTFDESSAVSDITRVLVQNLREATPSGDDPLAVLIRDMALVENPDYAADQPLQPLYVVLFDDRGYPLTTTDGAGGVSYPFVDDDGDGLADLNAAGEFIYQNGQSGKLKPFSLKESIDEPVVRDSSGRATLPGGEFAFQYIDIHATGLGFLVREFQPLSAQNTLYDLLVGFKAVMGPKTVYEDDIGGYQGYAIDQPLNQLTYAAINMFATPVLPDMMDDMATLIEQHPDAMAGLMFEVDLMVEILGKYPDAKMDDDETMAYDAVSLLREIVADPQLFEDLLWAFRQPISTKTGEALATLLKYKDVDVAPAADGPYDRCFLQCESSFEIGTIDRYSCIRRCPAGEIFSEVYDPSAPETERGRSLLQKFLQLIRDTAGQPYSMDIIEASLNGRPLPDMPPLMALDGAGEAFLASVAGNLDLEQQVPPSLWSSDFGDLLGLLGIDSGNVAAMLAALSPLFGAQLDVKPKPHQITRLFNTPDMRFETDAIILDVKDPVCADGFVMSQHLAYGLFVAEAAGVIDTIYPLAKAFSDNKKEYIMSQLLSILHDHYSGDPSLYKTAAGGQSDMKGGNLRSYEEALTELLSNEGLFVALNEFALAVKATEDSTGRPVTENLRKLLEHALKQDGFTTHTGEDFVIIDDGRTLANPSRMEVMLHAVGEASKRLKTVPETRDRLRAAVGNIADVMVGAEKDSSGQPRFKRTGSPAMATDSLRYLADRAREKQAEGQLETWLEVDVVASLQDFWKSRLLTSLVDLASNTLEDPADTALMDDFMAYLLGSLDGRGHVLLAIYQFLVSSVNADVWLPVGKFVADTIDPDARWETEPFNEVPLLTLGAQMLKKTLEYDPDNTGIFLIHRGLLKPVGADTPFDVLIDLIAAYFSPDPLAEQLQTPSDYQHFMQEIRTYIDDDLHGVERLYELVSRRQR